MKILILAILLQGCALVDTPRLDVPFVVLEVNEDINKTLYYADDQNWGIPDYWATPKEFYLKGGDCEDYAIAKYFALRRAGIPASRMMISIGEIDDGDGTHAILLVKYKEIFVLDNIVGKVTPLNEYIDFKVQYSFNENIVTGMDKMPRKWDLVMQRVRAGR